MHSILGFKGELSVVIDNDSTYPTAFCTALCPCSVSTTYPHTAHLLTSPTAPPKAPSLLGFRCGLLSPLYCSIPHFTIYATLHLTYFLTLFLAIFFPLLLPNLPINPSSPFQSHPSSYSSCSLVTNGRCNG